MSGKRKNFKIVGIDTNIFIYHYQDNPEFISQTETFFSTLEEGKAKAVTSIITLVELLSFKANAKEIEIIHDAFSSTPSLIVIPINNEIALEAAKIRREYNFRLPDAIQLATALYAKANLFITNDKRLQNFKQLEVKFINNLDS